MLDEIVRILFCLACTTWGGGLRGTECDDLKYANNSDGTRHFFIINNIPTFITSYNKNRNIHGASRLIAHAPSFQVSRLLLLLIGAIYPCAANLAPICRLSKDLAEHYLTHVFVQTGRIMRTEQFSDALRSFSLDILYRSYGMRDWRQIMCSIMTNIAHISFTEPDEEDEDLRAIHESFNHSRTTGEKHYGLQISNALPGFSHTAIASDQRVCFRWHVCLNQLHPALARQMKLSKLVCFVSFFFLII